MLRMLAPHHVQLVAACYPPSAALLTAGPEYKPNSQELSRLTYYASNRPGKITKLSNEIQKRIVADVRRARSGNARGRASLLISLNIFKALLAECRRDISLLSAALMSALDITLASLSTDLEVAAKTATVFSAWATYTTGQLLGVDAVLTKDYVSLLRRFASMSLVDVRKEDFEERNRSRLVGLGALTGAVTSEALYNSSSQFKVQVLCIVPAFLYNILQTDMPSLENEAENIKNFPIPLTSYLSDFRTRPILERRAASIHVHVDGDKGPAQADVANAALRALASLFNQSNVAQIGHVLQGFFDSLDKHNGWRHAEHCCWLAQKIVEWTQYQYRFAVPTRLVERLAQAQDDPEVAALHKTLAAMIKTVFSSSTPLVNLSTSDVMSNLTQLIMHRVVINPSDELLPDLVECIGALGTHIYYVDQIHDLACELIGRLTSIESNGIVGRPGRWDRKNDERTAALRCLISTLGALLRTSSKPVHLGAASEDGKPEADAKFGGIPAITPDATRTTSPTQAEEAHSPRLAVPQRTKVPPTVWQETLCLLCDETYAVRSDYARLLVVYLQDELETENGVFVDEATDKDGVKRVRPLEDGPYRRALSMKSIISGGSGTSKFLHALHATIFVLATSPRLTLSSSMQHSPSRSVDGEHEHGELALAPVSINIQPSTPMHDEAEPSTRAEDSSQDKDTSQHSQSSRRKSTAMSTQARKMTRVRRLLEQNTSRSSWPTSSQTQEAACATANDYVYMLRVLVIVHQQLPCRALLTGIPMLLALENWCNAAGDREVLPGQRAAIRELVARMWHSIAQIWNCSELIEQAETAVNASSPPRKPEWALDSPFPRAEDSVALEAVFDAPTDDTMHCVDSAQAVSALAASRNVQMATGMDDQALLKRLVADWTPEGALRDSTEQALNGDAHRRENINPVLKISPALMHIENLSLQSLARSTRGVGVSDLRDALEGRSGMSNLALSQHNAPSVSSFGQATLSAGSGESAVNLPGMARANRRVLNGQSTKEVRDVLDKLGIGARNGASLFKASLSARQRSARNVMTPPYKS